MIGPLYHAPDCQKKSAGRMGKNIPEWVACRWIVSMGNNQLNSMLTQVQGSPIQAQPQINNAMLRERNIALLNAVASLS
jgi:uncharacterized protein YifN (PemK superfamily)